LSRSPWLQGAANPVTVSRSTAGFRFIGYSGAFPLLIKTQFPAITVTVAFLGPLVGSLSRPLGGLLADKIGGARVTFWNFVAMGAATIGVM